MKYAYTYHFRPILYRLEIGCADLGADLRKLLPKSAQRSCARLGAWTFSTSAVLKPRPQIGPEPGPKSQRRRTIPATFMVRTFGAAGRRKSDIERVSSRRERRWVCSPGFEHSFAAFTIPRRYASHPRRRVGARRRPRLGLKITPV